MKIILFLSLLFCAQLFAHQYPRAGWSIDPDPTAALSSGESTVLSGKICVKRPFGWGGDYKCYNTNEHQVEINGFFPDATTPIDLNVNRSGHILRYSFATSELKAEDENSLTIVVGSLHSKAARLLRIKAKLQKRIIFLNAVLEHFHHYPFVQSILTHLRDKLQGVIGKIDGVMDQEPDTLAILQYPLQVDNNRAAPMIYSSVFGGFKLFFRVENGHPIEGESSAVFTRVSNVNDYSFNAPGMMMGWGEWHEAGSLYKIKYRFNNQLLHESEAERIPAGESREYSLALSNFKPENFNRLEMELVQTRRSFLPFFNNISWGEISQQIEVAADDIAPSWEQPISPEDGIYRQSMPAIEVHLRDSFGRIDQSSLQLIANATLNDGSNYQADFTQNLNLERLDEYGADYSWKGEINPLPEGNYLLSFAGADLAENKIVPDPLVRQVYIDRTAPSIIISNQDNQLTNNPQFILEALISDYSPTQTEVLHNGQVIYQGEEIALNLAVTLVEGINSFELRSTDAAGNVATPVYLANIELDTIPPVMSGIDPADGDVIITLDFLLKGSSNEKLQSVLVNELEFGLNGDQLGFSGTYYASAEGPLDLTIVATDLAGNSTTIYQHNEIILKVLYGELISIVPTQDGTRLLVKGATRAARPGVTVHVDGGFFNSADVLANADGSFEAELGFFTSVTLSATDQSTGRSDVVTLQYNVDTTLSGVVKDTSNNPLPGVTVAIESSGQSAITNGSGVFSIPTPATGDQRLIFDGTTIPESVTGTNKKFSSIAVAVNIGVTQFNVLETPIYLAPLLLDGSETEVDENSAVTVTSSYAPGVEIYIPAGVATFPDGSTEGKINMMEISKEVTSIPVLEVAEPDTVVALEPSGLSFSQPVELVLPNVNEFPAGIELVILSKNSQKGIWEIDGVATVSDDGQRIVTKEGMGITHFSEVYAAPLGPKIGAIGAQDRPGADTFNGAVSTSISLPSYKSLGEDIAPGLIYRSTWAYPTVVVSNLFDIPRNEVTMSAGQTGRFLHIKQSVNVNEVSWVEPDLITAQFHSGDIVSEKMEFTGMPNRSVISFAMDLSSLPSGVYPYSAKYEIYLKQMIIRTTTVKKRNFWGKTKVSQQVERETRMIEQAFPSDMGGDLFVQNKTSSNAGQGWMIGGNQRIENPQGVKLMVSEGAGEINSYVIDNTIETLYEAPAEMRAGYFSWPYGYFSSEEKLQRYDLETKTVGELFDIPRLSGRFGLVFSYVGGKCGNCFEYQQDYQKKPFPNKLFVAGAEIWGTVNDANIFKLDSEWNWVLDLRENNAPQSSYGGIWNFPGYLNSPNCSVEGVVCGGFTHLATYDRSAVTGCVGYCRLPSLPQSLGNWPNASFADGNFAEAGLNNPEGIYPTLAGGQFVVADSGNNRVRLVDTINSTITTLVGDGSNHEGTSDGTLALEASLYHPRGVIYDSVGNLYITTESGYIKKVDPSGRFYSFAGNPSGTYSFESVHTSELFLSQPYGMVIDEENGYLYVADTGNHRIVQIDLNTMMAIPVAGNGTCDANIHGDGGPALSASLCHPKHIGLDQDKNLLVFDDGHNKIRRVAFNAGTAGALAFSPSAKDNSLLVRNADGTFTRSYRNGAQVFFNENGYQIGSLDRVGRQTFTEYDDENRVIAQIDSAGQRIEYFYSGEKLDSIVDPAGRVTNFYYDGEFLSEVQFSDGTGKQFIYNDEGLMVNEINQRGHATSYEYNEWKRLAKVIRPDLSEIVIQDATSATVGNNYTAGQSGSLKSYESGELVDGIKDARGIETSFSKDTSGYISTIIDGEGKITTIERNLDGKPTKIIRPDSSEVSFVYDENTYDLLSKFDSATGVSTATTYDEYGNLLTQTHPNGQVASNLYDIETGQLLQESNIIGQKTNYSYEESFGLVHTVTNNIGQTITHDYDSFGNRAKVTYADNSQTSYQRDAAGNVIATTNAENQTTTYEYDSFNRLTAVITPKNERTQYSYLETGELQEIVDPYGKVTTFNYNELGQVIEKIDPLGMKTTMQYDGNGNVVQEIDPNGNLKSFEYDSLDQLTRKILPDNVYELDYDVRGNIVQIKNKNSLIDYSYDHYDAGDLVTNVTSAGLGDYSSYPQTTISYEYDVSGNRTAMQDPSGVTSYTYDLGNRLTKIKNHKNEEFFFNYDNINRLTGFSRPGSSTTISFDSVNFVTNIVHSNSGGVLSSFEYAKDLIGNRTQSRTPAGDHDYSYDKNNQLISATNPETTSSYAGEAFTYDYIGNRTTDQLGSYNYDPTRQRLQEDYYFVYAFDNNGNLTSKQSKTMGNEVTNFIYNSENQLIRVEFYDGTILLKEVTYGYDAIGRRMEKEIIDHQDNLKSFTRRYVYDGNEIILEYDDSNSVLAKYTHSGLRTDDMLAVDVTSDGVVAGLGKQAQSYFYIKDALGTVVDVADVNGAKLQHQIYSAFGKLIGVEDGSGNDIASAPELEPFFAFTGREWDEETGLYYYRARYYSPEMGRFLQVDAYPGSIGDVRSVNSKYIYGKNSPLSYVDPSGELGVAAFIGLMALAGAIIGAVDAAINDKNIFEGALKGAILGAAAGGLIVCGYASVASMGFGKSLIQALMTKGNVLDNFMEYSWDNMIPSTGSVGLKHLVENFITIPKRVNQALGLIGLGMSLWDVNKTACDDENATDFAKQNICVE